MANPETTIVSCYSPNNVSYKTDISHSISSLVQHIPKHNILIIYINANKTEFMCFKQKGVVSTLSGRPIKLVDQLTFLKNSNSSIESDVNLFLVKAWTAIDSLSTTDLLDKMKWESSQATTLLRIVYKCTTWVLTKCMKNKLDVCCTRMLLAL